MHHPTDRIAHTTAFVTPVVEHWLEREIAQWVHPMMDQSDDPSHHERTLLPWSYSLLLEWKTDQYVHCEGSIRWPIVPWANTLTMELHLAPGMKNISICPLWGIDPTTHRTMSEHSYHGATPRSRNEKQINKSTMRDRSDDPSHHERTLYYRS